MRKHSTSALVGHVKNTATQTATTGHIDGSSTFIAAASALVST